MSEAQKWHSGIMFPNDSDYIARVIGFDFGNSQASGNPMITLDWEIDSPAEKEIGDMGIFILAGLKLGKTYYSTSNPNDLEKQEKSRKFLFNKDPNSMGLFFAFELPSEDKIDWDNIQKLKDYFYGMKQMCYISADVVEKRKTPTREQIERAKAMKKEPEGDVCVNPKTGLALLNYYPKVRQMFGLVEGQKKVNAPY
jgi:hypothetical protein